MGGATSNRLDQLIAAEAKAVRLFDEVTRRGLVAPGTTEQALNDAIRDLANELYGIDTYWHKRIVRSGPNTLCPYAENPPDRVIEGDDIVFFDFGPVFAEWEADLGRTYVLGDDPEKHRLVMDIEACWALGKQHFESHPDITGAELFATMKGLAEERGWDYLIDHAGHMIGEFPHEKIRGDTRSKFIHPDNTRPLHGIADDGHPQDWILELHFGNRERQIGAFYEQLLTV